MRVFKKEKKTKRERKVFYSLFKKEKNIKNWLENWFLFGKQNRQL